MNEEEITLQSTVEQNVPSGKPLATETESSTSETALSVPDTVTNQKEASASLEEGGLEDNEITCDFSQEAFEDSSLPANSLQDPDPDSGASAMQAAPSGLDELRNELKQLRQELASRDAFFTRLGDEYEEFQALYPDVSPKELSESIWNDVRRGIPLAAAYALAERRRLHEITQAEKSNLENQLRSPGAISGSEQEYFTPAEVRSMSRQEVRNNYQKIMNSMKQWN